MANIITIGFGPAPILTKPLADECLDALGQRHLLEVKACLPSGDRLMTTWEHPEGQEVITTIRWKGESDESVRKRHLMALPWR